MGRPKGSKNKSKNLYIVEKPVKRGRGRPKGSTNKPKNIPVPVKSPGKRGRPPATRKEVIITGTMRYK